MQTQITEETDYDEIDEIQHADTVALNVVVDIKDTTLHNVEKCVDNDDSIYSDEDDEEVIFEELQDKYNLMYTKRVELTEINKMFKKDLQNVKKQIVSRT